MIKFVIDYLVNDLQVDRETATTVVLTLITFITGYLITAIVSAWSKWRKKISYRKTLKHIIDDFLKACQIQYKALEDFEQQPGLLKGGNLHFGIVSNFAQKYLVSLNVKDFIENFSNTFKKKRSLEISEFLGIVEEVSSSTIFLKQMSDMVYNTYNQQLLKYNDNLSALNRYKDSLIITMHQNNLPSLEPYVRSIESIFNDWKNAGGSTHLEDTYEKIIQPLLEGTKATFPHQFAHTVATHALEATAAYNNIVGGERLLRDQVQATVRMFQADTERATELTKDW